MSGNGQELPKASGLMTPGLVINGKVKVFGRVPKHQDIVRYIKEEM
ncbi:Thioredoxin domain-containing protein [Desulfotomaculum arcticum]|uniref:Thioredoxin domain-containing protein n=1 Tax=Desulfotruncus arcticus DSM 17038 TaxID=1121424 RepID=A0A1I2UW65_9FIRM|nr:thioredoxin family protein [Desulfotruncus arcticus]SFG81372.1 Thioredoxin domain-containing protein [Desulfotomaculum arcticum] [Desulfotruncus arcticus DSM 17038]